ncbi:uncharacterized protein BX664DRAFT_203324 [Halteromyces radiatus]|uniref:uncharacterized protein n=1 Tax=Halteromyces radiatus TaxID=101107 RepID=UPI0022211366|nr:uncharacterized protein BX664DRAFT_203324 [Halteromyces radiatus]KAI8079833.1 hypothetical protein BX664DRAFT_203324 [Halteromyces radiatus]
MQDIQMNLDSSHHGTIVAEVLALLISITDIDTLRNSDMKARLDSLTYEELSSSSTETHQVHSNQQSMGISTSDDPLTILDPTIHSLGYMYFITARCLKATDQQTTLYLYNTLNQFANVADLEQLKLAGPSMERIVMALDHVAKIQNNELLPLVPLYILITRLSSSDTTANLNLSNGILTIFHPALAKQCILSKMYRYPLSILNHDIVNVDPETYGTTIQHYLSYHYYGGILYIGNKEFEKAFDFFSLVVSAPTQKAVSAIQLEAYKRYILVSLIRYGQVCTLPRYASNAIEKIIRKRHAPYLNLMNAFDDIKKLISVIQKHHQVFDLDGLLGLTKQLIQASYRQKIKMLTKVYVKVKLDDIYAQLSGDTPPSPSTSSYLLSKYQVETLLVDMIGNNDIQASISIVSMDNGSQVKMVHFDEEQGSVPFSDQRLEQAIINITRINDQLSKVDQREGLNKDFQSKYMVLSANGGQLASSSSAFDEDMDVPLDEDTKRYM